MNVARRFPILRQATADTAAFVRSARSLILQFAIAASLTILAQFWNPLGLEGQALRSYQVGLPLLGVAAILATSFLVSLSAAPAKVRMHYATIQHYDVLGKGRDALMKNWLRKNLAKPSITCVIVFGSVMASYETRDVDVIVVLKEAKSPRLRKEANDIKRVAREFRAMFTVGLHLQFFTDTEREAIGHFLEVAGAHDVLVGRWNNGT